MLQQNPSQFLIPVEKTSKISPDYISIAVKPNVYDYDLKLTADLSGDILSGNVGLIDRSVIDKPVIDKPVIEGSLTPFNKICTVKFDANDGTPEPQVQYVKKGTKVKKPTPNPRKDGYTFTAWYKGLDEYDFSQPVMNGMTLKAKYVKSVQQHTVFFSGQGGIPEPDPQKVLEGDYATEPDVVPVKEGKTFIGWYAHNSDSKFDFEHTPITQGYYLEAHYKDKEEVKTYTVSFDENGGLPAPNPSMVTVIEGDLVAKPADPQKPNMVFTGWYDIGGKFDFNTPIRNNYKLWAEYKEASVVHKVSFDARDGVPEPNPMMVEVPDGELVAKPVDPQKPNMVFTGWYDVDGKFDFNTPIKKDYKLWAQYKEASIVHTVRFDVNGGSPEPNPSTVEVADGELVAKPVDPQKVNMVFVAWYDGEDRFDFNTPIKKDYVLKANYQAKREDVPLYQVRFETAGGEPVPPVQIVEAGNKAVEPETDPVKEDETFLAWYDAEGVYDFDSIVERDIILYAKYKKAGETHDRSRRRDIDVNDDDYDNAILQYQKPFFKGYPDNTFRPQNTITRAEMATVFARILGIEENALRGTASFSDLDGHWAKDNILRVAEYGLLNGYPDGSFRPEGKMTRAEIAAIINKYWGLTGFDPDIEEANITDIDAHWAKKLILALYNHRFVDLYTDNSFKPDAPLKRDSVAQILNRITDRPLINVAQMYTDVPNSYWAYKEVNTASSDAVIEE